MNQMTKIILAMCLGGTLFALTILRTRKKTHHAHFTIGILQTASHPALDAAREGFIKSLEKSLGKQVAFIIKNAEGSLVNAHAIAQNFHTSDCQAFFAIATPAAQALANIEKEKPIIIAAVTDPHAAGLIKTGGNVTGTSDMIDVAKEIELIPALLPHVKKVAILFSQGEINASIIAEKMITEISKRGLTPLPIGVSNELDLIPSLEKALRTADLLLTPIDNAVACAMALIAQRAQEAQKPLIVSDNLLVRPGVLAARGINYKVSGTQAGNMMLQILRDQKKPAELPIQQGSNDTIIIHQETAQQLGIVIPEKLKKQVKFILSTVAPL